MLDIRVSKLTKKEDFVAVDHNVRAAPVPSRHLLGILTVCVISIISAVPVAHLTSSPDDEFDGNEAVYAVLNNILPTRSNSNSDLELSYLESDEDMSQVEVTTSPKDTENYEEVNLPRDFFIRQGEEALAGSNDEYTYPLPFDEEGHEQLTAGTAEPAASGISSLPAITSGSSTEIASAIEAVPAGAADASLAEPVTEAVMSASASSSTEGPAPQIVQSPKLHISGPAAAPSSYITAAEHASPVAPRGISGIMSTSSLSFDTAAAGRESAGPYRLAEETAAMAQAQLSVAAARSAPESPAITAPDAVSYRQPETTLTAAAGSTAASQAPLVTVAPETAPAAAALTAAVRSTAALPAPAAPAVLPPPGTVTAQAAPEPKPLPRPKGTWYKMDIDRGDSLASIFNELSLPSGTLKRINRAAPKRSDLAMRDKDVIYFLIDSRNNVKEFVKPISKTSQVRFTRMDVRHGFTAVYEPLNAHVASSAALKKIPLALSMPLAMKAQRERERLAAANQLRQDEEAAERVTATIPSTAVRNRPQLIIGTIQSKENFAVAAKRAGLTDNEISNVRIALSSKINTRRMRPGDRFRILLSGPGAGTSVTAIEVTSGGAVHQLFRHPQTRKFYGENEFQPMTGVFRRFPLTGQIKINSPFNPHRMHPVLHRLMPHNGVDFKVPIGTPVYAPADGEVTFAGFMRGAGYCVILQHAAPYSTVYMHLSKFDVTKGKRIRAGQIIARSGNTGRSTGPHLHYEVRINDRPVDPLKVELPSNRSPRVAQAEREAFNNVVKHLKADLLKDSLAVRR